MVPVPKLKKLISGTGTEVSNITKAFTLVELIVVITILSILATIGFVSFSGYLAGTRDVNRISQLKAMSDALELYRTKKDLPIPDDKIDIQTGTVGNEKTIAYQGYIGKNVLETIEYTETGLDPKDKNYFSYYLTKNKKYFQLLAFLEEPSTDVVVKAPDKGLGFLNNIQATDYSERYIKTTGKKLGILTGTGTDLNTPVQELITDSLNIETTTGSYIANFSSENNLSGTGTKLIVLEGLSNLGGNLTKAEGKSCKEIQDKYGKLIDGIYKISPDGEEFEVYCDMSNGGRTIFEVKGNWSYIAENNECIDIELFSDYQIEQIQSLKSVYNNLNISTDIDFRLQADDSTNNSTIYTSLINGNIDFNINMGAGANNTVLTWGDSNKNTFLCSSSTPSSNTCGDGNKPNYSESTEIFILKKISFNPRCNGSVAHGDLWSRNKYTFSGTYYNVILSD